MSRFLSRWRTSEYFPLRSDYNPNEVENEIENEKRFARWASFKQLTSISGSISLLPLVLSWILRYAQLLLPSFVPPLCRRLLGHSARKELRLLRPTAYLDGLRGVAALIVYIFHFNSVWFINLHEGYGSPSTSPTNSPNTHLVQLPIVRAFLNGNASVTIFFVISGFVLPLKTVSALHAQSSPSNPANNGDRTSKVLDSLSGSLFRRPLRLFLPIIVSTGIIALLVRIPHFFVVNKPPRFTTLQDQLSDWWSITVVMIDPFLVMPVPGRSGGVRDNEYNGALWTIPVEFKGSVQILVLVLAFARTRRWIRVVGVVSAGWWQIVKGDFDMALFCAGLVLAEAHVSIYSGMEKGRILSAGEGMIAQASGHVITIAVSVVALYFMSYPQMQGHLSWGFQTMSQIVPGYYLDEDQGIRTTRVEQFWLSVGSILFVSALMY